MPRDDVARVPVPVALPFLVVAATWFGCAGPEIPPQSRAGGAGAAGTGAAGGSTGGAAGASGGAIGGTAGLGAGGTGGSSAAGTAGLAGGAGAAGTGKAGAAVVDVACDFSGAGTDCITCGTGACIDTGSDTKHCGACNHACAQGTPCRNGVCGPTIVTGKGSYAPGVLSGGRLFVWGSNEYQGVWGAEGGPLAVLVPREVTALGTGLVDGVAGDVTCGVVGGGAVQCFGFNAHGQVGNGQIGGPSICGPAKASLCYPTPQTTLVDQVTELREAVLWCGGSHLCARRADRTVACWGDLGTCAGSTPVAAPTSVDLPPSAGIAVDAGTSCSRSCTGRVRCWGENAHYGLGVVSPDTGIPQEIPDLRVTSLVGGYCGIRENRTVVCWGESGLGAAGVVGDTLPITVAGIADAVQLARGGAVCALTGKGEVYCWGAKYGVGAPASCMGDACPTPTKVAIDGVVEITSGSGTTMARLADGTYVAWGLNGAGQIGNGTATYSLTPVPVKNLPPP